MTDDCTKYVRTTLTVRCHSAITTLTTRDIVYFSPLLAQIHPVLYKLNVWPEFLPHKNVATHLFMNFVMFWWSLAVDQIFIWEWGGELRLDQGPLCLLKVFWKAGGEKSTLSVARSILRTISVGRVWWLLAKCWLHFNNLFTSRRVLIKTPTTWQPLMKALTDGPCNVWLFCWAEFENIYKPSPILLKTKSWGGPTVSSQYGSSHS